jgi:hypothetical protein
METLQGHCHCGGVQVSAPAGAFGVVACHCDDCQRLHGNFFAMVVAPAAEVVWSGELAPQWYDSSPQAQRAHCPRCGSRLAKRPIGGERGMLSTGLFGRHLPRRIEKQVFTDTHPDWYTLPAAKEAP